MILGLIASVARDGAIGRGNALLWRDPEDLRHLRATTMGCPVLMGRRTWESLPPKFRPLPGRRNVVLTRQPGFDAAGAEVAAGLDAALALVADAPRVWVLGGAELYAQALPRADELVLTEIDATFEGADAHFPAWRRDDWHEVERRPGTGADGMPFAIVTYRRRGR
ncbi:MAG: dihydrofolate reductase [Rubrivivax sp.]|jgi:dihydrofolate reductase|nr:dihydrofolate reductase [Rubrivivax sp.]